LQRQRHGDPNLQTPTLSPKESCARDKDPATLGRRHSNEAGSTIKNPTLLLLVLRCSSCGVAAVMPLCAGCCSRHYVVDLILTAIGENICVGIFPEK
jgi:hypothetical protein